MSTSSALSSSLLLDTTIALNAMVIYSQRHQPLAMAFSKPRCDSPDSDIERESALSTEDLEAMYVYLPEFRERNSS